MPQETDSTGQCRLQQRICIAFCAKLETAAKLGFEIIWHTFKHIIRFRGKEIS